MWTIRNWIFCFALCLSPALAKACDTGHAYSQPVHVEPGPAQEMRIFQRRVPDGCEYDLELKQAGRVALRVPIVTGSKNTPPASMHVSGQPGNPIEYRISVIKIPELHRTLREIMIYDWKTGGDAGASDIFIYGYFDGAIRRLLDLSEGDGTSGIKASDGRLHVNGMMTNSCMACGKETSMTLHWDKNLGGFVPATPEGVRFAKFLFYDLPGDGINFGYDKVIDQYHQASERLLRNYHKLYNPADKARRQAIRRSEIRWIEKKRRICGHQAEALKSGHLAIAECLVEETDNRTEDIKEQIQGPIHISGMSSSGSKEAAKRSARKATAATLEKCRNPSVIIMNQILFSRYVASHKGYYVTAITSEPYPRLSSGDVNAKHGRNVYCGFRDIYRYTKNPVSMGIQEIYRRINYDRFHVVTQQNELGGIHIVQPGGLRSLEDDWDIFNH